jgi:hypothetical protein
MSNVDFLINNYNKYVFFLEDCENSDIPGSKHVSIFKSLLCVIKNYIDLKKEYDNHIIFVKDNELTRMKKILNLEIEYIHQLKKLQTDKNIIIRWCDYKLICPYNNIDTSEKLTNKPCKMIYPSYHKLLKEGDDNYFKIRLENKDISYLKQYTKDIKRDWGLRYSVSNIPNDKRQRRKKLLNIIEVLHCKNKIISQKIKNINSTITGIKMKRDVLLIEIMNDRKKRISYLENINPSLLKKYHDTNSTSFTNHTIDLSLKKHFFFDNKEISDKIKMMEKNNLEIIELQHTKSHFINNNIKNGIKNGIKNDIKNDIKNGIKNDIKKDIKNGIYNRNNHYSPIINVNVNDYYFWENMVYVLHKKFYLNQLNTLNQNIKDLSINLEDLYDGRDKILFNNDYVFHTEYQHKLDVSKRKINSKYNQLKLQLAT